VFNVGQVAAVRSAFALAGFEGTLNILPVDSEDERLFVLDPDDYTGLHHVRDLEQVLTQLLGRKCAVLPLRDGWVVSPFEA
jgi:hypothetical protein